MSVLLLWGILQEKNFSKHSRTQLAKNTYPPIIAFLFILTKALSNDTIQSTEPATPMAAF